MTVLIHVLGSDILTITTPCCGFNDSLAATSEHARTFMVAGRDAGFSESCPALSLSFYDGKGAGPCGYCEGESGSPTALLLSWSVQHQPVAGAAEWGIKPEQFYWHIWGADLYEVSSGLKFRLFYPIRRMAQNRVGCVFATRGDLRYFAGQHPHVRGELLYFPTRMDPRSII